MISPLAVARYKTRYPDGVTTDNLYTVIFEINNSIRKYDPTVKQAEIRSGIFKAVGDIGTTMEDWFIVYTIHSLTTLLDRVERGKLKVRRPSLWKRLWSC